MVISSLFQLISLRIIMLGIPAFIVLAGISRVTIEFIPTTELSPIVTPFNTLTYLPSHTWLPIFTGFELFIPILGVMFVVSTVSVIIQVTYFKRTKKRIFKMAPIHHHFQMSGYSEVKIGYAYKLITLMLGLITIVFTLYFV